VERKLILTIAAAEALEPSVRIACSKKDKTHNRPKDKTPATAVFTFQFIWTFQSIGIGSNAKITSVKTDTPISLLLELMTRRVKEMLILELKNAANLR
jgi:hypothetical protein